MQAERAVDIEADFVVLGSGAAGLTGALTAAAAGLRVVLLEKSALIGGTTAMSGGAHWVPMNHHMADVGVSDSREEALAYLRACAAPRTEDAILETLIDQGAPMLAHLEALGVRPPRPWPPIGGTWDYRPWLPGAKHGGRGLQPDRFAVAELGGWAQHLRIGTVWDVDMIDYYAQQMYLAPPRDAGAAPSRARIGQATGPADHVGCGTALVGELFKACLARGVEAFVETPARALETEGGRVVGVQAMRRGEPWVVRARCGVLVATGGYTGNPELVRQWLNRPLHITCDIAENTGDGHLMGMAIGAQVAGLGDAWWLPFIHVGVDDHGAMKNIARSREDRSLPHTMIVNRRGRRFIDECANYYDFCEGFGTNSGAGARNWPAWLVFDQQGVERYAVLAAKAPAGEQPEWLTVGRSWRELAQTLGIDAAGLEDTARRFNAFARAGRDDDFLRGDNAWDLAWGDPDHGPNPSLGTLEKPPFYAVEVAPGALATNGGLRVNASGEVLSAAAPFTPIPGLYAAGNCSNGAPLGSYPGPGATIGAAMTFGYVAARRAAGLA